MVSAARLSTLCLVGASWLGNGYDQGSAWIWMSGICVRLGAAHETDHLEDAAAHPGVPADRLLDDPAGEIRRRAAVAGRLHDVGHRDEHVVVQVVAHGQVGDDVDAVLPQVRRRADAGQHQELRRAEDAGAQDHLPGGPDRLAPGGGDDLDAGGAAALDDDPRDVRAGQDRQARQAVAVQVADRGAVAQPAAGVLLEDRDAFLRLAVVVVDPGDAGGVRPAPR